MTSATRLLTWTAHVFGDEIADRVFTPLVADWQRDREAASTARHRVIRDLSGTVALVTTAAVVAARLASPLGLPGRDLSAIGFTFIAHAVVGLAVGLAPFVIVPTSSSLRHGLLVWMAPSMLAVSLTVALLPTAAIIQRRSLRRWALRAPWLLAAVTAATMAGLLAHVGWVTPITKQEFRVRAFVLTAVPPATEPNAARRRPTAQQRAGHLPRGVNELTLPELLAGAAPQRVYPQVTTSARRREATLRLALIAVWPATFAMFGWRLARSRRSLGALALSGWWTLAVATSLFGTFGGLDSGPRQLTAVAAMAATWLLAAAALRRHGNIEVPALT